MKTLHSTLVLIEIANYVVRCNDFNIQQQQVKYYIASCLNGPDREFGLILDINIMTRLEYSISTS